MENVINGTKDNLESLISNGKTTIVDFWAEWCGPCRTLGPILDNIAKENPDIQVVKVNVDENSSLASQYSIRSIPAVYIYKNGVQTDRFIGLKSENDISKLIR